MKYCCEKFAALDPQITKHEGKRIVSIYNWDGSQYKTLGRDLEIIFCPFCGKRIDGKEDNRWRVITHVDGPCLIRGFKFLAKKGESDGDACRIGLFTQMATRLCAEHAAILDGREHEVIFNEPFIIRDRQSVTLGSTGQAVTGTILSIKMAEECD